MNTITNNSNEQSRDDFARLEITTPFDDSWLQGFLKNPQRLLRINSFFEFTSFEKTGDNHWHMTGTNLSSEQDFDVTFTAEITPTSILISYEGWLKTSTKICIEQHDENTNHLIIIDDYSGTSPEEREKRISEVDNSIVQWGNDIHRYLHQWKRWSWIPGWKFYMLKYWQGMKPSVRRISFMIFAITAAEFVIFLFVFVIFWLELPKYLSP